MQGKVMGTTLVIMDSFALPVQGTEARVNAANEANEYMVEYIQGSEKVRCLRPHFLSINERFLILTSSCLVSRLDGWRTPSAGTTPTPATDAGYRVSTSTPK